MDFVIPIVITFSSLSIFETFLNVWFVNSEIRLILPSCCSGELCLWVKIGSR